MMRTLSLRLLMCLALLTVLVSPPPVTAQAMRSGSIHGCGVGHDCTVETIDGKTFYRMEDAHFVVLAALTPVGRYTDVEVRVTNRSGKPIQLHPAEFRIEIEKPNYRRLSALEPASVKLPRKKPEMRVDFAEPAPSRSFLGAADRAAADPGGTVFLTQRQLQPEQTAEGHVFFERAGNPPSLNLILPVSGSVFGFTYVPERR